MLRVYFVGFSPGVLLCTMQGTHKAHAGTVSLSAVCVHWDSDAGMQACMVGN